MKIEWKDATVEVHNVLDEQDTKPVEAKEAVGTGLGYTIWPAEEDDEELDDLPTYIVTHMPSGRRLHQSPCLHEEQAKRFIKAILPLFDWNRPLDALTADPNYLKVGRKLGKIYDEVDKKFWETLMEIREVECWPEAIASA